ncbi:50S ribosomal protein L25/general stress protein Ctc [candidate division KSB3 bacterium]|uniref:Large ribosomal subunit protein bL25 n=1 Tax=candidate division KSB3 bacterium TaxID=2044937 RepID=A0A2G6E4P4_9BACT|nr:MAG: 50S ribosomal protein L25/general stress protein Ctc [candidate division KSB3 bacterium]PIE29649.1 MAG: 50S ribosomal protein L25/general stress protein Ctc [candidate division KSB3 bacterium]
MEQMQLTSKVRTDTGKGVARKLRQKGFVPAVVYGGSHGNISLSVNSHDLRQILARGAGETSLVDLKVTNGSETQTIPVIIKEFQIDPVKRTLLHADFMEVTMGQAIEVQLPIELTGTSEGVKVGGILEFVTRELTVECLPSKILNHINVDISALEIGESLSVEDINLSDDYKILTPAETVVATVTALKAEVEEEEGEEEQAEPEVISKGKKAEDAGEE